MTPEALFAAMTRRNVILHRGTIFFQTTDWDVVRQWEQKGARIVPWYTLEQIAANKRRTERLKIPPLIPGWEVHVLPLLDPEWVEGVAEEEVNIAPGKLRELCLSP